MSAAPVFSAASIAGCIFTVLVSIALPVAALAVLKRKTGRGLLAALVGGRLVWGLVSIPIYGLLTEQAFTLAAFWMGGFVNAWPGIVLQIVLIPAIVLALEKAKLFQQQ